MKSLSPISITLTCFLLFSFILYSCVKFPKFDPVEPIDPVSPGDTTVSGENPNVTPAYIYPFSDEVSNSVAEITLCFDNNVDISTLSAEIPYLKYNKEWLLLLTQDDCKQAAYCRTWAVINGRPVSSSETIEIPPYWVELYYTSLHLRSNDLPPTIIKESTPLCSTDGAGKDVRFAFTTTLMPEGNSMKSAISVTPGFTDNYYRFYVRSGLAWEDVTEMVNYGVGIAFHDVDSYDVSTPSVIATHYGICQDTIKSRLAGRGCKMLTEPNGNKAYILAAQEFSDILTITAQSGGQKLYPFQVSGDLKQAVLERTVYDNFTDIYSKINTEMSKPKETREAILIGVHGTNNEWMDFFRDIRNKYGKGGADNVWFTSQEEYFEYNYYRVHSSVAFSQIDSKTVKLTVTLPSEKLFYYPSITVNLLGLNNANVISVSSNNTVSGLSHAKYGTGEMINIDCRKHLAAMATHYVETYESDKSVSYFKWDAEYFTNMLKDSDTKTALLKRIQ